MDVGYEHCKHGDFRSDKGCPQCIADGMAEAGNSEASIAEAVKKASETTVLVPTADILGGQINAVVEARQKSQEMADEKKSMYDAFIAKHTDFFADVATAATVVGEAEERLRELTLQAYAGTGNKAPAVGVGIRERTVLTYDGKVAFDWAKAHKMALKLDTSAFEKIAKADPPDFVKITTEPQATIATELNRVE